MATRKWHITILAVVLLVALAAVGVGYGLWNEWLYVNGTIETGHLEADWTEVSPCNDNEFNNPDMKDVGQFDAWIDPEENDIIRFHITNGYPGYYADCQVHYSYVGSIPVHVEGFLFDLEEGSGLTGCVWPALEHQLQFEEFVVDCDQLTVEFSGVRGIQLHGTEPNDIPGSFKVTVLQDSAENAYYTFMFKIQLNQYNESRW
jgi:hypothetical protein